MVLEHGRGAAGWRCMHGRIKVGTVVKDYRRGFFYMPAAEETLDKNRLEKEHNAASTLRNFIKRYNVGDTMWAT